ncbi:MAG: hypothetical protein K2H23_06535, partial [Oscillospiraceae bacterium]|nr:hypothetical protein [Oscillospiraceae bacterium]
ISDNTYDYFIRSVENNISASLESKLHENNIYPEEIETSINISDNGSISINEVKITLKDITEKFSAERCIAEAAGNETTIIIRGYKDESIG